MSKTLSINSLLPLLELKDYIALDIETTGLSPETDFIIEISACRFINGEFCEDFTTLVNPSVIIPNKIIEITGISDDILENKPSLEEVLPNLVEFVNRSPVVGHNVDFDKRFILFNCEKFGINFPDLDYYDTLSLAKMFTYYMDSFRL